MKSVRWGYFAKLLNFVVYEIVSNREVFSEHGWHRTKFFLHLPIDSLVMDHLTKLRAGCPIIRKLDGMTRDEYWAVQMFARELAERYGTLPINFDAAWSA
ncbi:MAG TPA: hypothetical protein VM940_00340 [Chthoniobacterales bacterium]|nr:hypothetical protein [Chthoniobacterales bacterium]